MIEEADFFLRLLPEFAIKIGTAVLCGFLLGLERERKDKPAGLRTVVLITVGATLFMLVSDLVALLTKGPESITRVDPSRIASQVVTGIGFLGGGAIIQARGSVHGLTTAAVIWVAAGIGLCIGVGFPMLAVAVTLLVLGVLVALDPIRDWMSQRGEEHTLELIVPNDRLVLRRIEHVLGQHDGRADQMTIRERRDETLVLCLRYNVGGGSPQRLIETLASIDGVCGARV